MLALNEAVDPAKAPVAATHAERVVFANLYETLTRMTCEGKLIPGLAERWESLEAGRRWRFDLRQNALLWDGTQVTASLVVESWLRNAVLASSSGQLFPGSWLASIVQSLSPMDEHTLQIDLSEPWRDLPRLLAHPDLAVAVERSGWLWPLGSGPCRLSSETDVPLFDLVCRPNPHHPDRPIWSSLTFRILQGRDARDLLDDGADLALFRGWRAASYYAQLTGVQTAPLPWDRLYLLLLPPDSDLDPARLAGLVHAPATLAESIPWTSLTLHDCNPGPCPLLQDLPTDSLMQPWDPAQALVDRKHGRILFSASDTDAQALADRLAAFLSPRFFSVATEQPDLFMNLRLGRAAGFVVRHGAGLFDACFDLSSLLAQASWLRKSIEPRVEMRIEPGFDPCALADRLQHDGLVIPLAATRAHLAWRGPLAGLELTHDGAPLVARLGLADPPQELP